MVARGGLAPLVSGAQLSLSSSFLPQRGKRVLETPAFRRPLRGRKTGRAEKIGGPRTRGAEPPLATIVHPSGMKRPPARAAAAPPPLRPGLVHGGRCPAGPCAALARARRRPACPRAPSACAGRGRARAGSLRACAGAAQARVCALPARVCAALARACALPARAGAALARPCADPARPCAPRGQAWTSRVKMCGLRPGSWGAPSRKSMAGPHRPRCPADEGAALLRLYPVLSVSPTNVGVGHRGAARRRPPALTRPPGHGAWRRVRIHRGLAVGAKGPACAAVPTQQSPPRNSAPSANSAVSSARGGG
jgi:hypothetical protein